MAATGSAGAEVAEVVHVAIGIAPTTPSRAEAKPAGADSPASSVVQPRGELEQMSDIFSVQDEAAEAEQRKNAFNEDEDIAELMRIHKVEGEKLLARAAAAAAATAKATAAAEDKTGADPWKDADPWKHPDVKTKIRDLEDKIEALHKLFTKGEQKGGYEDKKDAKEEVDDDGNPTGILSLKKLDRKDVDKPDKYAGGPDA